MSLFQLCTLVAVIMVALVDAFCPSHQTAATTTKRKIPAMVLDPNMMDAAIALTSAAAGAASQLPRIQQLESELDSTRAALTMSEQELVDQVLELEEKLFQMDEEFEQSSAKAQKRFDNTLRDELQRVRNKVKDEYQFTLDIKVQEERSKMLQEKLNFVGSFNGDKDQELVKLRLQQAQVKDTNRKLEGALENAQEELEKIQGLSKGNGWWPF